MELICFIYQRESDERWPSTYGGGIVALAGEACAREKKSINSQWRSIHG